MSTTITELLDSMARGEVDATGCTYAEAVAKIADARPELYKSYVCEVRARAPRPAPRAEAVERAHVRPPGPATKRAIEAAEAMIVKGGPDRVAFGDAVARFFKENPRAYLDYLAESHAEDDLGR